ncbi:cytochrome c oxidase assembly protein COX16 homolog, mitochondrial [Venturia canescens]|uniref:cytochrome c oxidase assembly protein COX16 homolog, mitochondrial n=1 Tax=Venturia canescens TaxID=32260 RepID=UPI001C9CAFED|nr:cytochrome c oxidase assembly protein COX16 homolog, mitochondrial [Venturia canescens]XP_043286399.1 cytochrome c oxidase assembly protein COX16 homolog, mitochondrial [Venturia canescens]XP_043286400.1 cytochrome c oxidase assembly protein COX16 homolog, mitochondrial [Venturia canescens]XP_043286402.1 cytochrome c oxidase assembly protein COX16 homolog, mitochondrial [Venturia canescens]XP_043286403.1 cytochrome c oxidase assembly protein COX16 homolog, mitochondrial [Venturia canescens]
MNHRSTFAGLTKNKSFKYGLPFLLFVIGGSFGLKEFTELRYRYSYVQRGIREELKEHGIEIKKPGEVTLESEYEKIKQMDIDNWENVRISRPWEEDGKEI